MQPAININKVIWSKLIIELRMRGAGKRESGAFLLSAAVDQKEIDDFICFDDCEPGCLKGSYIEFTDKGFDKLWEYCRNYNKQVVADIHTHPRKFTQQSETDRTHPMIVIPGHIALIAPHYAKSNDTSFNGVSAYEYLGNKQWKKFLLTKKMMPNGNH